MIFNHKITEANKKSFLLNETNGKSYEIAGVSQYQPNKSEDEVLSLIRYCFGIGVNNQNKPRREFNDLSLLQRATVDQMAYNNYLPNDGDYSEDSTDYWRSNAQRPIIRNKILSIAAHATARTIFPKVFAINDQSEEQREAANAMELLMEYDGEKVDYVRFSLYAVLQALFQPASITYREYSHVYRNIKTEIDEATNRWKVERILDEEESGSKAEIVPIEEYLIPNFYEDDVQKQDWIIRRRIISYDNVKIKYADKKNIKYVKPGVQVIYDDPNKVFYEVYDTEMNEYMVEEVIYWNKAMDLRLVVVNGVLLSEFDEPNPRRDKKYPFTKTYYESLDEGKFHFGMSLSQKMMQDAKIVNYLYQMTLDGLLLDIMPPMIASGNDIIGNDVIIPGLVTSLQDVNSKITPIKQGGNSVAGFNAIAKVEESINETSQNPLQQGLTQGGSQTAFEIGKIEQNANTILGLFLKMISSFVKQYGELVKGDILQYYTTANIDDLVGKDSLTYKTFILPPSIGRDKSIKFQLENLGDEEMDIEEMTKKSYNVLQEEKESEEQGNDVEIIKINPILFRTLKFSTIISPDILNPRSKDLERAYKLEAYDRMIQNPMVDQELVTKDFLLGAYSDLFKNTDKYMKEEEAMNPMVGIPQPAQGGEMNPSAQLLANNNQVTQ